MKKVTALLIFLQKELGNFLKDYVIPLRIREYQSRWVRHLLLSTTPSRIFFLSKIKSYRDKYVIHLLLL